MRIVRERTDKRLKYKKRYKIIFVTIALVICVLFVSTRYIKPYYTYKVEDDENAIAQSISQMVKLPVQIRLMEDADDKKIVLFTIESQIGEAELTKGPNHKYKLDFTGHGTNEIRPRIMETGKGQYVRILGRNTEGISKILTLIDGEKYELAVQEGDFFIAISPLTGSTDSKFPSGSVLYDSQGNEIRRIGISEDYFL